MQLGHRSLVEPEWKYGREACGIILMSPRSMRGHSPIFRQATVHFSSQLSGPAARGQRLAMLAMSGAGSRTRADCMARPISAVDGRWESRSDSRDQAPKRGENSSLCYYSWAVESAPHC
jgi:hypothetical protein